MAPSHRKPPKKNSRPGPVIVNGCEEWLMEKIVDMVELVSKRQIFRVRYAGYPAKYDGWFCKTEASKLAAYAEYVRRCGAQ